MLWVLKRPFFWETKYMLKMMYNWTLNIFSVRQFFWASKTHVLTDGQDNNQIFMLKKLALKLTTMYLCIYTVFHVLPLILL